MANGPNVSVRNSVSNALNVIVPIGGIGSRFAKEGPFTLQGVIKRVC